MERRGSGGLKGKKKGRHKARKKKKRVPSAKKGLNAEESIVEKSRSLTEKGGERKMPKLGRTRSRKNGGTAAQAASIRGGRGKGLSTQGPTSLCIRKGPNYNSLTFFLV